MTETHKIKTQVAYVHKPAATSPVFIEKWLTLFHFSISGHSHGATHYL
jgi:hypothetical protein